MPQYLPRDEFETKLCAFLHSLAANGLMPTVGEYDRLRPPDLPHANAVRVRLKLETWSQVARWAGLEMGQARAGGRPFARNAEPEARDPKSVVTDTAMPPSEHLVKYDPLYGFGLRVVRKTIRQGREWLEIG